MSLAALWPLLIPSATPQLPVLAAGDLVALQLQRHGPRAIDPSPTPAVRSVVYDLTLRAWRAGQAEATAHRWAQILGDWVVTPQAAEAGAPAAWLVEAPTGTSPRLLLFEAPELRRGEVQALGGIFAVGDLGLADASVRAVLGPEMLEAPSCFVSCAAGRFSRIAREGQLPLLLESRDVAPELARVA